MPGETILIVDDEPNVLEMVSAYLLRLGNQVLNAADGEEVLGQTRTNLPDLLMFDAMLAGDVIRRAELRRYL